jgi:hypothetical protein
METNHPAFLTHSPELVERVFKPGREMDAEANDFTERMQLLASDIEKFNEPWPDEQFRRRVLVRNLFVYLRLVHTE